jgi:hypothetical protein
MSPYPAGTPNCFAGAFVGRPRALAFSISLNRTSVWVPSTGMKRNLARIGLAIISLAMLAIGVLSLVDFWPRWVWISLGLVGLVGIVIQFLAERQAQHGAALLGSTTVNQRQHGGRGSTNNQAGRDINNQAGRDINSGDAQSN